MGTWKIERDLALGRLVVISAAVRSDSVPTVNLLPAKQSCVRPPSEEVVGFIIIPCTDPREV